MSEPAEDLQSEVARLVARVLRLAKPPGGEIRRAATEQWDSLRHVEIVFALEDRYGVRFQESEFAALDSTSAIATLLRSR